jgi:hypothetical protein
MMGAFKKMIETIKDQAKTANKIANVKEMLQFR